MIKELCIPILLAVIRHCIGWLGIANFMSRDEQNQVAGLLAALFSIGWSILDKYLTSKKSTLD
jgi:hypothetical protein